MKNKEDQEPKPLKERTFSASFAKDPGLNLTPEQQASAAARQTEIFRAEFPDFFNEASNGSNAISQDIDQGLIITPPQIPHQTLTRKKKKS